MYFFQKKTKHNFCFKESHFLSSNRIPHWFYCQESVTKTRVSDKVDIWLEIRQIPRHRSISKANTKMWQLLVGISFHFNVYFTFEVDVEPGRWAFWKKFFFKKRYDKGWKKSGSFLSQRTELNKILILFQNLF